jgi:pimeloyl-ACP methyl ester carboxylesterase
VVIEGGIGNDWIDWQLVQPELSKVTRVCTYDRAGLGWSELPPGQRDARHIAAQLHALLQAAGEKPPLLMIGASAGAFYVRQFYSDHADEVAGIVFSDGSVPEQVQALSYGRDSLEKKRKRHHDALWDWIKETSGWARLTGHCTGDLLKGLEAYAGDAAAEACRPSYTMSWLGEQDGFWTSAEQAAQAKCCGEVPVIVISQDPDRPKPGWDAESIAAQPIWVRLQESLKALSPHSRRIVARGSGHHVMTDRPDVLIHETEQLISNIRSGHNDQPYGTTVIE